MHLKLDVRTKVYQFISVLPVFPRLLGWITFQKYPTVPGWDGAAVHLLQSDRLVLVAGAAGVGRGSSLPETAHVICIKLVISKSTKYINMILVIAPGHRVVLILGIDNVFLLGKIKKIKTCCRTYYTLSFMPSICFK